MTLRRFTARGLSMLPALYPGDTLHVREVDAAPLMPGAIVAFPGRRKLVCHRVLATRPAPEGHLIQVRGDAQRHSEWVEASAVAYVLVEVDGQLGRWHVDGPRGRVLTRLATSRSSAVAGIRIIAARTIRRGAAWRRRLFGVLG